MTSPNLRYLEKQWLDASGAASAFKHQQSRSADELKTLLRHHDERAVFEPETKYRDAFDRLMMFYSLLEIGIMIGFVAEELPTTFKNKHLRMLADPAVRHYYEWNYPLDLPRRLRERLQTGFGYSVPRNRAMTAAFYEFLELTKSLENDDELQDFLWTLDSGYNDNTDITDVRRALKTPNRCLRAVVKKPALRTNLDHALNGFAKFIPFCEAFHLLLKRVNNRMVAEAMWLAHAYWFRQLRLQMGDDLERALKQIADWESGAQARTRLAKRIATVNKIILDLSIPPLSRKPLVVAFGVAPENSGG